MSFPTKLAPALKLSARWLNSFDTPYEQQAPKTFGTSGRVYLVPIDILWAVKVDAILWQIGDTYNGGGGRGVRACLYKEGSTLDEPEGGELVVEGEATIPNKYEYIFDIRIIPLVETLLSAGRHWMGIQSEVPGASFCCGLDSSPGYVIGRTFDRAGGYGPFPNPCPATSGSGFPPRMKVRVVA